MPNILPLRLLLLTFAGIANRRRAAVIDYLVEDNACYESNWAASAHVGRLRFTLPDAPP